MNLNTAYRNLFKYLNKLLALVSLLALVACSNTPSVPPDEAAVVNDQTIIKKVPKAEGEPPMSILKAGKPMLLVRTMEGGACKNVLQGTKGVFLLYADADDIKRIKARQGSKVFAEFEKTITEFSVTALQKVVNQIKFNVYVPGTDQDAIQQNLTQQFQALFQDAIASSIAGFETKSGLKIVVQPFTPELVFYQNGCDATKDAEENDQAQPSQSI